MFSLLFLFCKTVNPLGLYRWIDMILKGFSKMDNSWKFSISNAPHKCVVHKLMFTSILIVSNCKILKKLMRLGGWVFLHIKLFFFSLHKKMRIFPRYQTTWNYSGSNSGNMDDVVNGHALASLALIIKLWYCIFFFVLLSIDIGFFFLIFQGKKP